MWQFALLSVSPISELRGGIPVGIALGYHPLLVFLVSVCLNTLIFIPLRWLLDILGRQILKLPYVGKVRDRGRRMVDRYGLIGLALLVGIPLPFTGVYTASLASWSLKYGYMESLISIFVGTLIAGTIVTMITLGVIEWVKV